MVSYGSCSNCIPFDQRRRQVLCRACKYLTLLMKVALLLSSWEMDTQCCLGAAGKQQCEHHIPRQKLLTVCFLKEKVYTDPCVCTLCAQVPCSETFRRVDWLQAGVLCLHKNCKIRSWKQNQPNTSSVLQNYRSSHYKPLLFLYQGKEKSSAQFKSF